MRRRGAAIAISMMCGLSACAKNHGEIAPEPIPPDAFEPATCRQLALMHAKAARSLVFAELAQDYQYAEDRKRAFGVPTLMATIFEESAAPDVSRLKGESLALAAQIERAGCVARDP